MGGGLKILTLSRFQDVTQLFARRTFKLLNKNKRRQIQHTKHSKKKTVENNHSCIHLNHMAHTHCNNHTRIQMQVK